MNYHPPRQRRSIRLPGHDYTQPGAYFITICTHQRQCLFGDVVDGALQLNELGQIVAEEWQKSAQIRREIELDDFVVMPNHLHGIIWICELETHHPTVGADGIRPAIETSPHPNPPQYSKPTSPAIDPTPNPNGSQNSDALPFRKEWADNHPPLRHSGVAPGMKPKSISSLIAGFKSIVTRRINRARNASGAPVWQRNYYERIIRDETALIAIRRYIHHNPAAWSTDQHHPNRP
jgi:REP element-mobilizing transposase RayT